MENPIGKISKDQADFEFDGLVDFSAEDEMVSAVVRDASSEGTATQAGLQMRSLQSAMDNYAAAMNQSAIAKSTGLPVRTLAQQYKGFAAEEYFKNTMKIKGQSLFLWDRWYPR